MTHVFTDLDVSTVDPEHASVFVVEFLVWWHDAGRKFYHGGADEGLELFAQDAVTSVGGWANARRVIRSQATKRKS